MHLNSSDTHFKCRIHRTQKLYLFIRTTAALGINTGVNKILGIIPQLKITSQAANFTKEMLWWKFSCEDFELNSFYTRRIVEFEAETSANV
jgi:hypothetical protein